LSRFLFLALGMSISFAARSWHLQNVPGRLEQHDRMPSAASILHNSCVLFFLLYYLVSEECSSPAKLGRLFPPVVQQQISVQMPGLGVSWGRSGIGTDVKVPLLPDGILLIMLAELQLWRWTLQGWQTLGFLPEAPLRTCPDGLQRCVGRFQRWWPAWRIQLHGQGWKPVRSTRCARLKGLQQWRWILQGWQILSIPLPETILESCLAGPQFWRGGRRRSRPTKRTKLQGAGCKLGGAKG
jgi:hypothetical protein